jgi:hypothetical protein
LYLLITANYGEKPAITVEKLLTIQKFIFDHFTLCIDAGSYICWRSCKGFWPQQKISNGVAKVGNYRLRAMAAKFGQLTRFLIFLVVLLMVVMNYTQRIN